MAHSQGSVVKFIDKLCFFGVRNNTEQELRRGRRDLTTISFVKPLYNFFCKGLSKWTINKSVLNGVLIPTIQVFVIGFDTEFEQFFPSYYDSVD